MGKPTYRPATSVVSARTDFASACRRNGDVKFLVAAGERDESVSQFSCHPSTPAPDPSPREDHRFPRRQRITRGADLQAVAREGKRLRTALLDVRVVITPQQNRVGFVVPKHGRSAVRRNRLKRSLRELTRLTILSVLRAPKAGSGMDIVMRALPAAYNAPFTALREEFESLSGRLVRYVEEKSRAPDTKSSNGS